MQWKVISLFSYYIIRFLELIVFLTAELNNAWCIRHKTETMLKIQDKYNYIKLYFSLWTEKLHGLGLCK